MDLFLFNYPLLTDTPFVIGMGGQATKYAGHSGCHVEMSDHLALSGTHLQLGGHHRPNARGRPQIWYCGQILEGHTC